MDFRIYLQFAGIAKWGPTEEFLEVRRPGEVFIHQPAQPHMMVVPGDARWYKVGPGVARWFEMFQYIII